MTLPIPAQLMPAMEKVLPEPFSQGAPGACLSGDTVYWDTLAPRIAGEAVSGFSDGPGVPDKGVTAGLGPTTVRNDA